MAAITQTTRVARSIIHKTGRGSVIFNDRLADGKRSLKVWGWDMGEYMKAKRMLEKQGCVANIIKKHTSRTWRGKQVLIRLHVTEKAAAH